ncbi:hypothetical protein TBLA_0A08610 [Henningerozyma blattae CBS 6284]|uniref:Serine/threonine-protein phosphatase n=1 Tax=Henningerozyma blattae (strain ATCC 34711 / CBS 6284 / DSM 70876 / NBRC 10599 / NRRL Y-10934 / UCD 77-7) TaxID=1071380 RepID=I2GWZ9_HENB6|nr:hypothetical protein TBLA_0A08610 [Tetrapisispora blattae CBS 6284]CCH58651.1 hypothetical protein TBLA_0A08610 [Tetrapisispora blattae CBS 6284]
MLDRVFQQIKAGAHIEEEAVYEVCLRAQELLVTEANIGVVDTPVIICGDLHGQLHDLWTLFENNGDVSDNRYLFLGDFVDRGFYSLESFLLLLLCKLRYPDRVTLLRGNHESRQITRVYGFYDEVLRKYGNSSVWRACCEVFDYLALGAVVDGRIFCVHGGLSPEICELDRARAIDRKQEVPHEGAMCDLLWSDPEQVRGWAVSPRGAGYLFGRSQVSAFLHTNGLDQVARAHQLVMEGYREMFGGRLVTVWSAPNYCYRCGNVAAVMRVPEAGEAEYRVFESAGGPAGGLPVRGGRDYFL